MSTIPSPSLSTALTMRRQSSMLHFSPNPFNTLITSSALIFRSPFKSNVLKANSISLAWTPPPLRWTSINSFKFIYPSPSESTALKIFCTSSIEFPLPSAFRIPLYSCFEILPSLFVSNLLKICFISSVLGCSARRSPELWRSLKENSREGSRRNFFFETLYCRSRRFGFIGILFAGLLCFCMVKWNEDWWSNFRRTQMVFEWFSSESRIALFSVSETEEDWRWNLRWRQMDLKGLNSEKNESDSLKTCGGVRRTATRKKRICKN